MATENTDIRALVASKDAELTGMFDSPAAAHRFREAIFQLWADPDQKLLRDCRPESIVAGFMAIAELGLTLNKQRGHAYLVPFGSTATPMIGYRGLIHLALQCGGALDFRPGVRYEKDEWAINPLSPTQPITHIPADGNRGKEVGYYCVVFLPGGLARGEYMTKGDVEKHRDRYSKAFKATGKWGFGTFDDMALKTVVRRVCKFLRLSGQFEQAINLSDAVEVELGDPEALPADNLPEHQGAVAKPVIALKDDRPLNDAEQKPLTAAYRESHNGRMAGFESFLFRNFGIEDVSDLKVSQLADFMKALENG